MQTLLVLNLVAATAAGGYGLVLIADDLETSGDWFDGLGVARGVGSLVVAVVARTGVRDEGPRSPTSGRRERLASACEPTDPRRRA